MAIPPCLRAVGEWKALLVREYEEGIQGQPSFVRIRSEFVSHGVTELVPRHSTIGFKKSLETIHLIQGEMTQPPTGTVTWVSRKASECSKINVFVFLGARRRERLKDNWQHVAGEFLNQ